MIAVATCCQIFAAPGSPICRSSMTRTCAWVAASAPWRFIIKSAARLMSGSSIIDGNDTMLMGHQTVPGRLPCRQC